MHMDDKTYELVTFWLIAAHFIVSLIMIFCNKDKAILVSSPKTKKSVSKKGKGIIDETKDMLEGYVTKLCSLLKNNKLIWIISALVCLIVCILLGLSIWMEGDDDLEDVTETTN